MSTFRRFVDAVRDADGLLRFHFLFPTGLWPILGVATVRRALTMREAVLLVLILLCYHVFAFVFNDYIDLPIDRTQPARQRDPLVRGAIRPGHALFLALAAVPVAGALTVWLAGAGPALAWLGVAFVAMAAYDVFGKRCPVPPLTDAVQAVSWGSMAIFAAHAVGPGPNALTWFVAWHGTFFILLVNGVHGGIRDLDNDLACGAKTTAIFFGVRPLGNGRVDVPAAAVIFSFAVGAALVGGVFVALLRNEFGYSPGVRTTMLTLVGALDLLALALLYPVLRPRDRSWQVAFRLQMLLILLILPVAFVPYVAPGTLIAIAALLLISVICMDSTYYIAGRLGARISAWRGRADDPFEAPLVRGEQ